MGYNSRVTSYSNDGGIDVILDGPCNEMIGIQVKRYKNSINVEQIRSLAGALYLGGFTKGIFVTTSTFQSGASKTCDLASKRGIPIELIDSEKFYSALSLSQREKYTSITDETAPFFEIETYNMQYLSQWDK